jgi:hypothetical protein
MAKKIASLIILLLPLLMVGCSEKPKEAKAKPEVAADPKRAPIQEKIDKTTPEGKEMIEKVKAMKPEVNEQVSALPLGEIVDDYAKNKGSFNIKPIGWEASQKKNNNWKIAFHFQDYNNQYRDAEWEYNPETKKLYPFEFDQAPTFWTGVGGSGNSNSKGKK